MRFPGQRYDSASGLHYNYFRDYDPTTGRYTQSDPIGLAGGMATYGYAGGNPFFYLDSDGLAKFGKGGKGGKGERNHAAKSTGTPNPYKHMKQDPRDSNKVLVKDTHTGKEISKPKPPDFDKQSGKMDIGILEKIGELLIPWFLIPSELGCSSLDCSPENLEKPIPNEVPHGPEENSPNQECEN